MLGETLHTLRIPNDDLINWFTMLREWELSDNQIDEIFVRLNDEWAKRRLRKHIERGLEIYKKHARQKYQIEPNEIEIEGMAYRLLQIYRSFPLKILDRAEL
ncbi:MAG: hypothetical protein AAB432_01475 [Patescibacteria group bacterium]